MKAYLRILAFGHPYGSHAVASMGLSLLQNLFNIFSLTTLIPFLEVLFGTVKPPAEPDGWRAWMHRHLQQLIDAQGPQQALVWLALLLLGMIVLKSATRYAAAHLMAPFEHVIIRNMRERLLHRLTQLPLGFFTHTRKGQLMNTLVNDVQIVREGVVGTLGNLVSDPLAFLTILVALLLISWKLTLFLLVVLPVVGLVVARIARSLKKRAHKGQLLMDNLLTVLDEYLGAVRVVKATASEGHVRQRYAHWNDAYTRLMIGYQQRHSLASPVSEVIGILAVLAILLYGGNLILSGTSNLQAAEFVGYLALFSQLLAPMKTFSGALARVQRATVSFARVEELLNTPLSPEASGGMPVTGFAQQLDVHNLSFGFEGHPVLHGVSLTLKKGQTLALVGSSGSGKTTLVDLICRFYEPQQGSIELDGVNIAHLDVRQYRALFGIVPQEPVLFNESLRDNLKMGRTQLTDTDLEAALKAANALEFVQELPDGLNTPAGERGTRFSGGQRQRLALARALAGKPLLLVLDEATSALDANSEKAVQQALNNLRGQQTMIIIAHRLSTVRTADCIVVLDAGRVVEQGTHDELLARQGRYAQLVHEQL